VRRGTHFHRTETERAEIAAKALHVAHDDELGVRWVEVAFRHAKEIVGGDLLDGGAEPDPRVGGEPEPGERARARGATPSRSRTCSAS